MAVNALRDDLFSLITAFASPRQGPKDNVAVIAQEAQEQAQQPQAQEVPDAPLPFVAPQPVASKLVGGTQVAGSGVVPTDPESTGSVTPSGPQTPRPPGPTVIPELPPKPATPPPAANDPNASTGFIGGRAAATAAPIADVPDDGGFNAFQAYQAAQDKAAEREAKAHAMQSFISGGQMLAGSLTRSPSMRENLFGMAQQNAPRGGGGGDGSGSKSGAPSLTEFTKLHELALTAAQRKSLLAQLPALQKQTGASMERLRLLADTDPKRLAEFIADASKSDKVTGALDDGTLYSYEKKDPKGTLQYFGKRDEFKVRDQAIQEGEFAIKAKEEDRKAGEHDVLLNRRKVVEARAKEFDLDPANLKAMKDDDVSALFLKMQDPTLPIEQKKADIQAMNANTQAATEARLQAEADAKAGRTAGMKKSFPVLSKMTNIPISVLEHMTSSEILEAVDKQPEDVKKYLRTQLESGGTGVAGEGGAKPGETYAQRQERQRLEEIDKKRIEAGLPPIAAHNATKREKLSTEVEGVLGDQRTRNLQLQQLVNSKDGVIAGTAASGLLLQARKFLTAYENVPDEKINATEALSLLAEERVGKILASGQYGSGTGISNADQQAARARSGGDLTKQAETIRRSLLIQNLMGRADVARRNSAIDQAEAELGPSLVQKTVRAKVPEIKGDVVGVLDNQQLAQVLTGDAGKEAFDGDWGAGATDEVIKNLDEGIKQKLATWDEKKRMQVGATHPLYDKFTKATVANIEEARPQMEALLQKAKIDPSVLDVIIAAKKLGKMGGDRSTP